MDGGGHGHIIVHNTKSDKRLLFLSELLGELAIHKYNCKEGQAKPSFLDMAEVIIASTSGSTSGIKKEAIFEVGL